MCYGDPVKTLAIVLDGRTLPPNENGHTVLDLFQHFCDYSGCQEDKVGREAYAWAKLAYISARLPLDNEESE
jgi:hypothetical protein